MNIREKEALELHKKYAPNKRELELVFDHCKIVAEIALWCADNQTDGVDKKLLETAALLHDIGSYPFLAAERASDDHKKCYPQHAILGAKILTDEGINPRICSLVETHVLLGLTKDEIDNGGWFLPSRNYEPDSIEGRLLCYADRFHSKVPAFNSYNMFLARLRKNLPQQAKKFEEYSEKFGTPNLTELSKKYAQPIR